MHTILTRRLSALAGTVCLTVALASTSSAAQSPAPACSAEEGAAVETKIGLAFCSGTSTTKVATADTPQSGARVIAVAPGGMAHQAGLRVNDVVYQVAGKRVPSGKTAADAVASPEAAGAVLINFWRDGRAYLVRLWMDVK